MGLKSDLLPACVWHEEHPSQDFFLLVLFRKLPGRNVYAQMHNEKEQEMTSPVNHSEDTQNIIQGEEFIDDDLDSQTLGNARGNCHVFMNPWKGIRISCARCTLSTVFPDSPIHFFCFLYILCCLLYRNPHLGTPQHHYLAVTPSGRSGNLNSYRVPLLLMPVSVQSQVSGMLNGRLRCHSPPSPAPLKTTTPF
ncbi:hypothetical protein ASZ78_002955 [Callipepla squamata]|uniref:Uncharacterized protein n=1 Tax=Callipepla squamata TaxID=9009 RepID=A0A226N493_CALSU|nr:hypothetical protein ASZ78_002955 [Callipepla squamata]